MIRPFGIALFAFGVAITSSGWWLLYHERYGFVHEFHVLRDCAAGNALIIVGGMATLLGIYLIVRPKTP